MKEIKTASHFSTQAWPCAVLEGGPRGMPEELSPVAEHSMGDCSPPWQVSLWEIEPGARAWKVLSSTCGQEGSGILKRKVAALRACFPWIPPPSSALCSAPLPTPSATWASFGRRDLCSVSVSYLCRQTPHLVWKELSSGGFLFFFLNNV